MMTARQIKVDREGYVRCPRHQFQAVCFGRFFRLL
jgi:hypothetical protein